MSERKGKRVQEFKGTGYLMTQLLKKLLRAMGVAGVLSASCAFGQVIRLSEKAVVEPGQDVRLGNIATVTGVDAQTAASLADTVILPSVDSGHKVRAESVLMAVVAQLGASGLATQLQLSGAAECEIVIATPAGPGAATAVSPAVAAASIVPIVAVPEPASPSVITASVVGNANSLASQETSTLAKLITARLEHELSAGPGELVVSFETLNPLLDQAVQAGEKWEFQPLTRTFLGTVQWHAELVKTREYSSNFPWKPRFRSM